MPKAKKLRTDHGSNSEEQQVPAVCVLHASNIEHGKFIPLSDTKSSPHEKLAKLHSIRDKRLLQPQDSPARMEVVCSNIPESLDGVNLDTAGYHRGCYQRFTKNLDRLKYELPANQPSTCRSPRKLSSSVAKRLFQPECIFCEKLEVKIKGKTERCIKFPSFKGKEPTWAQIEPRALELGESRLHRMVMGEDLFAREACYHRSCFNSFNLRYLNHQRVKGQKHDENTAAHQSAFNAVLSLIYEKLIGQKEVVQLKTLCQLYIQELEQSGFPNPSYKSHNLRLRLEGHPISESIGFTKVNTSDKGCINYTLVYSTSMSLDDAVACAYRLGSSDKLEDVALILRGAVQKFFNKSTPLPWPPTADELEAMSSDEYIPPELVKFLAILITGDTDVEKCEKSKHFLDSIAQDICRAVTNGNWKLPKHILLCATLRHLYRSKQLTTMLNKLGHCESYDFSLELESALTEALDKVSSSLTPQFATGEDNEVFHVEWDNLNKITTNVHGPNVVNSTGGIMIQEVKPHFDVTNQARILPLQERNRIRGLKVDMPPKLAPFHIYGRVGPTFPAGADFSPPNQNNEIYSGCIKEYRVWLLARKVGSSGVKQLMPGFGGFVSATGLKPSRKSTIDYFTPIHQPFTDYSVIRELLKLSEDATKEVGQEYVLSTFDLGGCMKALPLIWKFPDEYKLHVVTPGSFHTVMNYMGMLTGHKCAGSGYSEILLEAGLVTSGSLTRVVKGKAYAKALFCLKTVSEAMERLLIDRFIEEEKINVPSPVALLSVVQDCSRHTLNQALQDPTTQSMMNKIVDYEDKVRDGHLGRTAMFWLSVMDHTRLILMLLYAVKTNNFDLFHKCNGDMADLFFAYDAPNYSRYLVWLDVFLTNIDKSHPRAKELLRKGGIAVARSLIPGALSAVDKTMEETFMKFAKSTGGFIGLFSKFGAYQRWCRTTSTRAQYFQKMLDMCGLIDDPECPKAGKHRELEKAEIKKSEEAVQRAIAAINNFTNPFTLPDKEQLYSLASGAPVSAEVETDVLHAEVTGKQAKKSFIEERFVKGSSEKLFFEPIKKLKLKTMDASNKTVKLTASHGKVIQYREQSDLAFMLLVKSQQLNEPLNLNELMRYSLTLVPRSLGTADGFFNKTDKAAILPFLLGDVQKDVRYPNDAIHIEDGNALFHTLTNISPTFGEICLQMLDYMVVKKNFIFSTDSYYADSIKTQERLRRGVSQRYLVQGPATRKPSDMKLFLANDDNKTQLCQLLLRVWRSNDTASRLEKCGTALVVVEGKAYELHSSEGKVTAQEIHELMSNQEETDTRIVLYLKYAAKIGYKSAVVRTPDTDIFVILLFYASSIALTIFIDIGIGKHRKIVNVSEMAESMGVDKCSLVLGLYVFTGEDVTSSFKGKGKVGPLKMLERNPKYHEAFRKLGDEWSVKPEVIDDIEAFTCLMYGYSQQTSIDAVRGIMLRKMVGENEKLTTKSKVDLSRLPPCRYNLIPHIGRVNHRIAIYKRAHIPIFSCPKPYDPGQGWEKNDKDILEPVWSCGPVLPPSLIDLVESTTEEIEQSEGSEQEQEEDSDYGELSDHED